MISITRPELATLTLVTHTTGMFSDFEERIYIAAIQGAIAAGMHPGTAVELGRKTVTKHREHAHAIKELVLAIAETLDKALTKCLSAKLGGSWGEVDIELASLNTDDDSVGVPTRKGFLRLSPRNYLVLDGVPQAIVSVVPRFKTLCDFLGESDLYVGEELAYKARRALTSA